MARHVCCQDQEPVDPDSADPEERPFHNVPGRSTRGGGRVRGSTVAKPMRHSRCDTLATMNNLHAPETRAVLTSIFETMRRYQHPCFLCSLLPGFHEEEVSWWKENAEEVDRRTMLTTAALISERGKRSYQAAIGASRGLLSAYVSEETVARVNRTLQNIDVSFYLGKPASVWAAAPSPLLDVENAALSLPIDEIPHYALLTELNSFYDCEWRGMGRTREDRRYWTLSTDQGELACRLREGLSPTVYRGDVILIRACAIAYHWAENKRDRSFRWPDPFVQWRGSPHEAALLLFLSGLKEAKLYYKAGSRCCSPVESGELNESVTDHSGQTEPSPGNAATCRRAGARGGPRMCKGSRIGTRCDLRFRWLYQSTKEPTMTRPADWPTFRLSCDGVDGQGHIWRCIRMRESLERARRIARYSRLYGKRPLRPVNERNHDTEKAFWKSVLNVLRDSLAENDRSCTVTVRRSAVREIADALDDLLTEGISKTLDLAKLHNRRTYPASVRQARDFVLCWIKAAKTGTFGKFLSVSKPADAALEACGLQAKRDFRDWEDGADAWTTDPSLFWEDLDLPKEWDYEERLKKDPALTRETHDEESDKRVAERRTARKIKSCGIVTRKATE